MSRREPARRWLEIVGLRFENRRIAAASVWVYVAIGAVAVALAGWIILLLLIVWGRRDAPPYWEE